MTELLSASDHAPPRDSAPGARAGDPVFELHRGGKIEVSLSVPLDSRDDLSMAYTPGVARVCTAIADQPELGGTYTRVANTVAVVSDGTAVLGLGDIGPAAAMPVMEGKAAIPGPFDPRVAPAVANAVATQAWTEGLARI